MKRRNFIKTGTTIAAGVGILSNLPLLAIDNAVIADAFTLPKLPYLYGSLEPFIDEATMNIHHSKHHAAYVAKLNAEATKWDRVPSIEDTCKNISTYNQTARNNAGGHYNHSFFWTIMCAPGHPSPTSELVEAIIQKFGSMDGFKAEFKKSALALFGSGWTWLIVNKEGSLEIGNTANQDNPLMDISSLKGTPVLGLDIWEHAYYLKHQNKRTDYIDSWWNVVNWQVAAANYKAAVK